MNESLPTLLPLASALVLGLVGSLHCAAMCGPLALALPATGNTRSAFLLGRLAYHFGRLISYACLGAVSGLIGHSLVLAGLQRWVSLAAGLAILAGLGGSARFGLKAPVVNGVLWLKSGFATLLRRRSLSALLCLGALNGLLPCGLVYAACAGGVAAGGFLDSIQYMVAFGLGTLPMMLGIGLAGNKMAGLSFRFRFQKVIPAFLLLLSALLILRGLSLGIPYLSPDLSKCSHSRSCCP